MLSVVSVLGERERARMDFSKHRLENFNIFPLSLGGTLAPGACEEGYDCVIKNEGSLSEDVSCEKTELNVALIVVVCVVGVLICVVVVVCCIR